ncbi:MAG: hypothetical protein HY046_05455 [Acidobacteria bacterium]|nr:hypothetical protein [Acidobacteriota bacterium]
MLDLKLAPPGAQGKPVPREFFTRPLWKDGGGIPEEWQGVVNNWANVLDSFDAPRLYDLYLRVCRGEEILWEDAKRWVLDWAGEFGDSEAKRAAIIIQGRKLKSGDVSMRSTPTSRSQPNTRSAPVLSGVSPTSTESSSPENAEPLSGPSSNAALTSISAEAVSSSAAKPETTTPLSPPPPKAQDGRPGLQMLADGALEDERFVKLGFKEYADALARLINHPDLKPPFTVAINAPWGAGKTTLGKMVERRLKEWRGPHGPDKNVTCWFNAWMHDDAKDLAAAFAASVARSANDRRSSWRKILNPVPSEVLPSSTGWWRNLSFFAGVLILAIVATRQLDPKSVLELILEKQKVDQLLESLKSFSFVRPGLIVAVAVSWLLLKGLSLFSSAAKGIGAFVKNPKEAATRGTIRQVSDELGKLISQATPEGSRFIIFVDDLERCRPPRSVDVLEVVNQLLGHENVVAVVMADLPAVGACVEIKYAKLARRYKPSGSEVVGINKTAYGIAYLQKIIQFTFDVPPHTIEKIRELSKFLLEGGLSSQEIKPKNRFWSGLSNSGKNVIGKFPRNGEEWVILTWALFTIANSIYGITFGVLWYPWVIPILLSFPVLLVLFRWFTVRQFQAIRKLRERIRTDVQMVAARVQNDPGAIESEIAQAAIVPDGNEDLIREQIDLYLVDDSTIRQEAESEVLKYIQPLPRNAKRMLNRLRFLLHLAAEKKLFVSPSDLSPKHLGKWAAIRECWPELARELVEDPRRLAGIESAAANTTVVGDFQKVFEKIVPGHSASEQMLECFRAEPKLTLIFESLIHFEPATSKRDLTSKQITPPSEAFPAMPPTAVN